MLFSLQSCLLNSKGFLKRVKGIIGLQVEVMNKIMEIGNSPKEFSDFLSEMDAQKSLRHIGIIPPFLKFLKNWNQESFLIERFYNNLGLSSKYTRLNYVIKNGCLTEILFILGNILMSRRKIEVQKSMHSLQFLQTALFPLFHVTFKSAEFFQESTMHENDALHTLRIQLMRNFIQIVERDSPFNECRNLFTTPKEVQVFKKVFSKFMSLNGLNVPSSLDSFSDNPEVIGKQLDGVKPNEAMAQKDIDYFSKNNEMKDIPHEQKGVLSIVINCLNKCNKNDGLVFWIYSFFESYLRGNTAKYRVIAMYLGLSKSIIELISDTSVTKKNNIQIAFDLLGELVKYNQHNFLLLNTIIKNNPQRQEFLDRLLGNIVDTNVFLRSFILTIQKFDETKPRLEEKKFRSKFQEFTSKLEPKSQPKGIVLYEDLFLGLFLKERQNEILQKLLDSVNVMNLGQENICCINSALIILFVQDSKSQMMDQGWRVLTESNKRARTFQYSFTFPSAF